MRIEYLADHPDLIPTLARWHYDEWQGLIPEWSYAEALRELATHTERAAVPTTIVALEGDELIGSASLLVEDLPEWKHLTPWVASVFVVPAWRGKRVGSRIVEHAVAEARQLGIPTVYLLTEGQAEFYRRLGWAEVEVSPARGHPITIMTTGAGR